MDGKFVFVSGSAGRPCPSDKLDVATKFVRAFTGEVLIRGGGVVVLAGDEGGIGEDRGPPHVFDWVTLQEVERYATSTTGTPRSYARVVMSDAARESKIDDAGLRLLRDLEQRGAIEFRQIRREMFTGGEYRRVMVERSDAMVAIGGGKGTYAAGTEMMGRGNPVLPLDLQLGSTTNDGGGAVALHKELTTEPERFFPCTHREVVNRTGLLSLDRGVNRPETVARVAAEMLAKELEAVPPPQSPSNAKRKLLAAWKFVKAVPIIAGAIKVIEWVKGIIPFMW